MGRLWSCLAVAVLALCVALVTDGSAEAAGRRVALVVGNSAYKHAGELENPKNDAADMAAALKKLDFQVIDGIDLDKAAFDRRIRDFATALVGAEVAVLFYAGHGLQVGGQNYLVPTDAELTSAAALDFEMVRIDLIQRSMEREAQTNILFLDACRNNPLARNLARAMGTRSAQIGRGLASIESGVGTLISFSTQPGNVALDGTGRNSPFAGALVKHLSSSSDDLSAILISVRNDVMRDTQRQQVPWEHSALTGRFYFKPGAAQASPSAAQRPQMLSEAAEAWSAVKDSTEVAVLQAYIARFKETFYAELARARIEELKKTQQVAVAAPAPVPAPPKGCQGGIEFLVGRLMTVPRCMKPGDGKAQWFRDCDTCPEMVLIPGGSYQRGASSAIKDEGFVEKDEGPPREVKIANPVAVGRMEVSVAQYARCAAVNACKPPEWRALADAGAAKGNEARYKQLGTTVTDDRQPVVGISWEDAQAYVKWLSKESNKPYRLPTEAEWEFAARGGSAFKNFWWGDEPSREQANFMGTGGKDSWAHAAPGGQFPSNDFGIHDMHGNVWEWVEDCHVAGYANVPTDGRPAPASPGCARVIRGGSWNDPGWNLRSANRDLLAADARDITVGFRVARTIGP